MKLRINMSKLHLNFKSAGSHAKHVTSTASMHREQTLLRYNSFPELQLKFMFSHKSCLARRVSYLSWIISFLFSPTDMLSTLSLNFTTCYSPATHCTLAYNISGCNCSPKWSPIHHYLINILSAWSCFDGKRWKVFKAVCSVKIAHNWVRLG